MVRDFPNDIEVKQELRSQSISTDRATIGDIVDTLQGPSWHVEFWPVSRDNLSSLTTNSGVVGNGGNPDRYLVRTGGTGSSEADLWQVIDTFKNAPSWDSDRYARFQCGCTDLTERGIVETGFANPGSLSQESLGFRFEGGDVLAFAADGTTTTTATAVSGASAGTFDCYLAFEAGVECQYWVDSDPQTDPADATISTDLPSGTTRADRVWTIAAENPDSVNFDVEIYHAEVLQV